MSQYVSPASSEDGGGGAAWGDLTGTLADQTDLQTALDLKVNKTRTVVVSAAASVSPTAADSGKQYRLTHVVPTFNLPASAGCTIGGTHFFVQGVSGDWDVAANGADEIEHIEIATGTLMGVSATSANIIPRYSFAEVRYVAAGKWALIGVMTQP